MDDKTLADKLKRLEAYEEADSKGQMIIIEDGLALRIFCESHKVYRLPDKIGRRWIAEG